MYFSAYSSHPSPVKFIPKSFILFSVIVSGIIFLIYFPDSLFLEYSKPTDFCILICVLQYYWIYLLVLRVLDVVFRVPYIKDYFNCKHKRFYFSFLIWVPFTAFSCLLDLAWTSSTMLNRSAESRHSSLVSNLRQKAFSFHCWVCYLWDFHIYTLFCSGTFHLFLAYWEFLFLKGVEFCQMLFLHLLRWLCDFNLLFS